MTQFSRKLYAVCLVILVALVLLFAISQLAGCAVGPTTEEIAQANQLQVQIDQLRTEVTQPFLQPETVETLTAEIEEKEQLRDDLLESTPVPTGDVVKAIVPWLPPPFNAIAAALIGISPLLIKRKGIA